MTLFEYLSVAVSIVLSLSVAQILARIRSVFANGRRYWVHATWTLLTLFTHVMLWWEFWGYHDVERWTLARFFLVLVNPGLLFIASNALVSPDREPDESWEDYFFSNRRSYLLPFIALLTIAIFRDALILDRAVRVVLHLPEIILIGISVISLRSDDRRVHGALAAIVLVIFAVATVTLWLEPGGVSGA